MGMSGHRCGIDTVLGIDLGTSKVKVVLVGEDGTVAARAEGSYETVAGSGGVVEQNPADWILEIADCIRSMSEVHDELWPPVACCVTGQMHGLVVIGNDGSVLRRAIICSDNRADAELRHIESVVGHGNILSITGNPGLTVLTGPKLLWVKKHEPEVYCRIQKVLLPKDYVGYKMTGNAVTDPSDASGTMLYDYQNGSWDERLCIESGAEARMLPNIRESTEIRGQITREFAQLSGIPEGTPVVMGAGDLTTTAVGIGVEDQDVGLSLGTAGIVFRRVHEIGEEKLGKHFYFRDVMPGSFLGMGCCPSAGLSVRWFHEAVSGATGCGDLNIAPSDLEHGCGTPPMYIPFLVGTGTPYMNYLARAAFIGLGPEHTAEDMYKAILEGVSFSLRQSYELLGDGGSMPPRRIIVCGGASSNPGWMKIMASILGREIEVSRQKDVAALGAAILGGVASGWWSTLVEGGAACSQPCDVISPDARLAEFYESLYQKYLTACDWLNGQFT